MIVFISNNRKKHRYFSILSDSFTLNTKVKKLNIDFNPAYYYRYKKQISHIINESLNHKYKEIDLKYKQNTIFKNLYKFYIKAITPFIASWSIKQILKADAIAIWNGQRFPENLIMGIANHFNKKTVYFEVGFFPNTTVIDPKGVNYKNSLPRNIDFYKNYPIKENTFPKKLNKRNHLIKRRLEYVQLPEKYIFVPFQTSFDTQIVYNSPWIKSMPELFNIIEKIAVSTKTKFIFKEHPHERDFTYEELHKRAESCPYIQFANANETDELIKNAEAVITINSTVGLEAMLMNKRVIVLGNAFYALDKITKKASNEKELEEIVKNIDKWKPETELMKRFLSFLINEYLVKGTWTNPNTEHVKAAEKRIKEILNDTYYDHFGKK